MATTPYTDWVKVLSLYETASDIEPNDGNQTALLQKKTDEFTAFIRKVHKAPLSPVPGGSTYDEIVQLAVAHLVIEELKQRRHTDDGELTFAQYPHISGYFTNNGHQAHGIIGGIIRGSVVLTQDHAEKDITSPEAVPVVKTGSGELQTHLPYVYDSKTVDIFRIKITDDGRADDGSAKFTLWKNNDELGKLVNLAASSSLYHIGGNLYIRFVDTQTTGVSFNLNDEWTITAVPPDAERQNTGPRPIEFFSS